MRLLIVGDAYPSQAWPDANSFIHAQLKQTTRLGLSAEVLCPTPYVPNLLARSKRNRQLASVRSQEIFEDIGVFRPRFPRPPGKWFRPYVAPTIAVATRRAFARRVHEFRPDLVHAHMALPAGYATARWATAWKLPMVLTLHGLDITQYPQAHARLRLQATAAISRADRVLCVSDHVRNAARAHTTMTEKLRTHRIGVDTEVFRFQAAGRKRIRLDLDIPMDAKVMSFIGRIDEKKGVIRTAELFERLAIVHPDLLAMFVGDGPALSRLRAYVTECGLGGRARFIPAQPHRSVADYLSATDVLLLPSHEEGLGLILLEAQAVGIPVVAYQTSGIVEAIKNGTGGILVTPDDLTGLRDAVDGLISGTVDNRAMGTKGRDWIKANHCAIKQTQVLVDIYAEIVGAS